jgi:hypothetical protein
MVSFMPRLLYPEEIASGTHCIGDWVGLRTGVDDRVRRKILFLPRLELRPLCSPARSQSPYRLRYPGYRIREVE